MAISGHRGLAGASAKLLQHGGRGAMLSGQVIAVVDDDEPTRDAIVGFIRSLGFVAAGFGSAPEFLGSADLTRTVCLIADVEMPGMNGLGLYHRLIALGRPTPTILVSAFPDEKNRLRALKAGVTCYLPKPFRSADLLNCLRSSLAYRGDGPNV